MLPLAHICGSYILLLVYYNFFAFNESFLVTIVCLVFSLVPDLDLIYFFRKGSVMHHNWITHTPMPYFLLSMTIFLLFEKEIGLGILIGAMSHMFMDCIGSGDGIMLLWPISKRKFALFRLNSHGFEWLKKYVRNFGFLELLLFFLTIYFIYIILSDVLI